MKVSRKLKKQLWQLIFALLMAHYANKFIRGEMTMDEVLVQIDVLNNGLTQEKLREQENSDILLRRIANRNRTRENLNRGDYRSYFFVD